MRRNLSVMSFEFVWPQNESFIHHMLDSHPSLHKLSHFDMVVEHLVYNKKEFQKVMPKDTVYISSIREPVAQFKSGVNFLRVSVFLVLFFKLLYVRFAAMMKMMMRKVMMKVMMMMMIMMIVMTMMEVMMMMMMI